MKDEHDVNNCSGPNGCNPGDVILERDVVTCGMSSRDTTSERTESTAQYDPPGRRSDTFPRRLILKSSAFAVGTLGTITSVAAHEYGENGDAADSGDDNDADDDAVDEPVGFSIDVLAPHATFPDQIAAAFSITYPDGEMGTLESTLEDASTVVVAEATWEPAGTVGWHTHPGTAIVNIVEGELDVTNERDCVTHTYGAGEAFVDPGQGNVHIATNPSDTERTVAYATFLGVPDGEPATEWVQPVDC